ncbi:MAG: hypothetical protein PHW83_09250 [Bacteroidales bacterium]|nr:hypothetical protein [Bacteroidales bacterium]
MEYLEKLYHKCKEDGHFNKFNTYIEFTDYFKNIETYRKLWDFLLTKGYKIPDFEEFLTKVMTPQANQNNKETNVDELIHVVKKWGAFKQPIPAVDKIVFNEENGLKLPDLIRFGEINCDGNNQPIPALLPFSKNGGITLWTSNQEKKDIANKMIEVLTYRLLLSIASNQAKIYVIDNEKNGVSFSSLFGLDSKILVPEIWDDENEILVGLTDLKNQVPIVLSKYLQNIYYDLAEYNEKISHSNQPFQFVLVANFPRGFNNESASKLKNLIENGHKAGIFILMSVDTKAKCPDYMTIDEFKTINSVLDLNSNMVHNVPNVEYYNSKFYISSYDTELPKDLNSIKTNINAAANKVKAVKLDVTSRAYI